MNVNLSFPKTIIIGLLTVVLMSSGALSTNPDTDKPKTVAVTENKEKSLEDFKVILSVLKNPRCINCHPSGDVPLQGNDQHLHRPLIVRGVADYGPAAVHCNACHHEENNIYANVPGAPKWVVAPRSMGWVGLTDEQIGEALMNKTKNGGRSPKDLVQHMGFDSLVIWAWHPGEGRTPIPIPLEDFRKILFDWLATGAYVPK